MNYSIRLFVGSAAVTFRHDRKRRTGPGRATMRMWGRLSRAAIAITVAVIALGACGFPDRREAADAIGDAVRRLPGVADERVRYDTSFDGGAHVSLDVTMTDQATADQAAAVGRTVVDGIHAGGFEQFEVTLDVTGQRDAKTNDRLTHSHAGFTFPARGADDPSTDEVAGDLALWAQLAASPALTAVQIQRSSAAAVDGRGVAVAVRPDAADADLAALTAAHPEVATARWLVEYAAPNPVDSPRTFARIGGGFPDTRLRDVWARIVELVGPRGAATIDAVAPPAPGPPHTEAELSIDVWDADGGPIPDEVKAQRFGGAARSVLQLLAKLGPTPVAVHLTADPAQDARVVVGGCSPPAPSGAPTSLEVELRRTFERC
jgi:hypothetical protein